MTRLWPSSIVGRTLVVLLAGLVVSNLIGFALYWRDRSTALYETRANLVAERITSLADMVEDVPASARESIINQIRGPGFRVVWTPDRALAGSQWFSSRWADALRSALLSGEDKNLESRLRIGLVDRNDPQMRGYVRSLTDDSGRRSRRWPQAEPPPPGMGSGMGMHRGPPGEEDGRGNQGLWREPPPDIRRGSSFDNRSAPLLAVSLNLSDGSWLNLLTVDIDVRPFWSSDLFLPILAATLAVIAISVLAVWRATAPLAFFTRAAERLGRDVKAPPLKEDGPGEVRRAARAFNEMQKRLGGFIEDRTRMLAAISHDLRTPITRMRLRAEFVEDDEQRRKMLDDLAEMEAMIAATLSFAREDAAGEARVPLDLADLLQSLCDAAVDAGHQATYEGERRFTLTGGPMALKRAFGNLIDNAVKYGKVARVALATRPSEVAVTVDDDGPGIPESEREKVFTAFYRIEGSRSRETGGVGLGLSVVRTIVRAHGGEITLENRQEGGLRATVTLPRDGD